jgi:hypothetical protein
MVLELLVEVMAEQVQVGVEAQETLADFLALQTQAVGAAVLVVITVQRVLEVLAVLESSSFVTQLTALHLLLQQATLR